MSDEQDASDRQFRIIDSQAALRELVPELMKEAAVAVDLEADSMFHFTEKVCLVQIAAGPHSFVIDPLAIPDLSSLQPFFAENSVKKIFHGADYDIRSLHRDFGIVIENLFDTEVACRFLGFDETGLNAVLQRFFGVALEKKYQKSDWSRRPLPPEMVNYATADVRYLVKLYHYLEGELEKKGRKAWVEEECRLLCGVRHSANDDRLLFKRVKGAGRLDRRSLAVLEKLLKMRLDIARRQDRPPFKVMSTAALLKIAEEKPKSREALIKSGAFSRKQIAKYADRVLKAVFRAMEVSEEKLPVYPRQRRHFPPPRTSRRIKTLKQWRQETAARLGMDPGVILPNALLAAVAEANPGNIGDLEKVAGIKNWQVAEFGEMIMAALRTAEKRK